MTNTAKTTKIPASLADDIHNVNVEELFLGMKARLMKRGLDEADAEEEAAAWVKMNQIFAAEETSSLPA